MSFLFRQFWEVITEEHDIDCRGRFQGKDPSKLDKVNVYFDEKYGEMTQSNTALCQNSENVVHHGKYFNSQFKNRSPQNYNNLFLNV